MSSPGEGNPPPAQPGPPVLTLPRLVFGVHPNTLTVPIMKALLIACGFRGASYYRRDSLLTQLQITETTTKAPDRRTIQHLLENRLPITKAAILKGIQTDHSTDRQGPISSSVSQGPVECEICAETKERTVFPKGKITPTCVHESDICKDCLTTDINIQIGDKNWDLIKCPVCSNALPTDVVKQYTTPDVFEKFNDFMVSWHMKDIKNFRWCQNPSCSSGQVYPNALAKRVICYKCGNENCFHCLSIWHEDLTCKKSQKARIALLNPDEATRVLLATTTNICPDCGAKVERNGGCPNMICTCGAGFRWETPDSLALHLPPLTPATFNHQSRPT